MSILQNNVMLQRQRPFSGSNVGSKGQRWSKQLRQQSVRAGAVRTPYPETSRQINTEAPTDVLYDAVIVGGGCWRQQQLLGTARAIATEACMPAAIGASLVSSTGAPIIMLKWDAQCLSNHDMLITRRSQQARQCLL
jgi:hypothetical protein